MRKYFWPLVVSILCAGCVSQTKIPTKSLAENQIENVYLNEATGMKFPERLRGFKRVNVKKFDNPAWGVAVSYEFMPNDESKPGFFDVFVYPAPPKTLNGAYSDAVKKEFYNCSEAVKQKTAGAISVLPERVVKMGLAELSPYVYQALFHLPHNDGSYSSSKLRITAFKGQFVKLRTTVPISNSTKDELAVSEFSHDGFADAVSELMLAAGYQNETFAGDVKLSTQGNKAKIQYDPNAESSFEGLSQVIRDLGDRTK